MSSFDSINEVRLMGRLGQAPELSYTGDNLARGNFSLATNRSWQDRRTGEWREETDWHRVVCWGRLAERVADHVEKGQRVHVSGRLQTRSWEDRDGVRRYITEVVAASVVFLEKPRGSSKDSFHVPDPDPSNGAEINEMMDDLPEDDIPF